MTWRMPRSGVKLVILALSFLALLIAMTASVLLGLKHYTISDLITAYRWPDGSNEQLILTHTRVPRALVGAAVGASLAIAGALLQVLTKNELASPSVFGINSGASLFLVLSLSVLGTDLTMEAMIWFAFAGAAASGIVVFILGSQGRGGFHPVKLTLAGAALASFAGSVTAGTILIDKQSLDQALFWMIGSVVDRKLEHLAGVLPYLAAGWLLAITLALPLNIMSLGDDVARSLGQRVVLIRVAAALTVILLAGGSVAVSGPIAFVGIIVPHLCRSITGNDHRWLIPYCAVIGALLLVLSDLLSRFLLMPEEVPVGVATAVLGVPFLVAIARRRRHG